MYEKVNPINILRNLQLTSFLIFSLGTTHILIRPMSSSSIPTDSRNTFNKWKELSHAAMNEKPSKHLNKTGGSKHFLIFDAIDHKGSFEFLNSFSARWEILVVNSANRKQLESCRRCQVVNGTKTEQFLETKMELRTWKQVPGYAKEKIFAILHALLNSAEWLYVTDSQFLPEENTLLSVCVNKTRTAPVYYGPDLVFEPCGHFMDPYTWHSVLKPVPQGHYTLKNVPMDAIHMVVDNCCKEHMDAQTWRKGFDIQAPRPYTTVATFSSVNFRNVLVSRNMAWSLVASLPRPVAQSSQVAWQNVLLNLMVQRILWETIGMIGFLPSLQSSATPACPSCEISTTIQRTGWAHIEKLSQWRCEASNNLMQCFQQLNEDVSSHLFSNLPPLAPETHVLLRAWIEIFSSHHFLDATRIPLSETRLTERFDGLHAQITAAKSMHVITPAVSIPLNTFADLCKAPDGGKYANQIPKDHPITDILLVIIFNWPGLVTHIPLLEYLYGRHFKHIMYCSSSMEDFQNLYATNRPDAPVNFVEVPIGKGLYGYGCIAAASRMGYQVAGYLQVSDDVILNAWNLYRLPRSKPWFQKNMRVGHIDWPTVPDIWTHKIWGIWRGGHAKEAYQRLQTLRTEPGIVGKKVSALMDTLHSVTGCDRCLMYEASDIVYIPHKIAEDFSFFSDIFRHIKVHLEIAIPSTLTGLVRDTGVYRLRGSYLWYQDRERYPFVYTQYVHFHHSWKFSRLQKTVDREFFCREVLARMDRDVMTHKITNSSY